MLALADVCVDGDLHVDDYVAVSADIAMAEYVRDERLGHIIQVMRHTFASYASADDVPGHAGRVWQLAGRVAGSGARRSRQRLCVLPALRSPLRSPGQAFRPTTRMG